MDHPPLLWAGVQVVHKTEGFPPHLYTGGLYYRYYGGYVVIDRLAVSMGVWMAHLTGSCLPHLAAGRCNELPFLRQYLVLHTVDASLV